MPALPRIARFLCRVFFRLETAGNRPPQQGPLLLVANHPNSLLDAALVAAGARRPVRFLAKSTLFSDRLVGWLIRAVGSIPVYRRDDDPSQMHRNQEAFAAAFETLAAGSAVALFPEGLSHSEPAIAPLRTGAARIALGAAAMIGSSFPIVPIGLVFANKDRFRSRSLVVRGREISWQDLGGQDPDDPEVVRELTARIDHAIRGVTLNLETWRDRPIIECGAAIWASERAVSLTENQGARPNRAAEVRSMATASRLLSGLRAHTQSLDPALPNDIAAHARQLRRLRLSPELVREPGLLERRLLARAVGLFALAPLALVVAIVGLALFIAPYLMTRFLAKAAKPTSDRLATHKLFIGVVVFFSWTLAMAIGGALLAGRAGLLLPGALLALVFSIAMPIAGLLGLLVREEATEWLADLRRYLLVSTRHDLVDKLRQKQSALAARINRITTDPSLAAERSVGTEPFPPTP